jgi:glucose/mannose-6-phosphate isomerase
MEIALKKKSKIVCITSGGKVAEMARENSCDLILIPPGNPPRASLGYSLTQLFYVLHFFGIINDKFKHELDASITLLNDEQVNIKEEALEVAELLFDRIPVIYTVDGYNGVATRFRQQLNENSKMLCWHHIVPEMNHNELVGWAGGSNKFAVIFLRNKTDYTRSQKRIDICKEVITKYTPHIKEIWSKGESSIERSLYLIHLTDWVSVFLADKKGIDATEVKVIDHLKGSLAKI